MVYPVRLSDVIMDLSHAAYDEIEQKLLGAGYYDRFEAGPGSAIHMDRIIIIRERTVQGEEKPPKNAFLGALGVE